MARMSSVASLIFPEKINVVGARWIPEKSSARYPSLRLRNGFTRDDTDRDEKSWKNVDDETVELKLPQRKRQLL